MSGCGANPLWHPSSFPDGPQSGEEHLDDGVMKPPMLLQPDSSPTCQPQHSWMSQAVGQEWGSMAGWKGQLTASNCPFVHVFASLRVFDRRDNGMVVVAYVWMYSTFTCLNTVDCARIYKPWKGCDFPQRANQWPDMLELGHNRIKQLPTEKTKHQSHYWH